MATWVVGQQPGDDFTDLNTALNDAGVADGDTFHIRDDAPLAGEAYEYNHQNLVIEPHPDNASERWSMVGPGSGNGLRLWGGNNTVRKADVSEFGVAFDVSGMHEDLRIWNCQRGITNGGSARRCFIYDTTEYAILVGGSVTIENVVVARSGGWSSVRTGQESVIRHLTIVGVPAGREGLTPGILCEIFNVYIEGLGTKGINGGNSIVRHAHVHGTWTDAAFSNCDEFQTTETTDAADAAVFLDAASDDYRPGAGSPLIGAGIWADLARDFDGVEYGDAISGIGQASFDGTDDYLQVPLPSEIIASDFSTFFWIRKVTGDNLMTRYRSDDTTIAAKLDDAAGGLIYKSGTSQHTLNPSRLLDYNGWFFVGWTVEYATRTVKLYRDGVEVATAVFNADWRPPLAGDIIRWGQDPDDAPDPGWVQAKFSQITYWDAALTPAEVDELRGSAAPIDAAQHSKALNLVAAYNLDGDADDSAGSYDATANGGIAFAALELRRNVTIGAYEAVLPPEVASVAVPAAGVLRVTFTKEMQNVPSLVKVENYTVTPIDGARAVGIRSVTRIDATNVDLACVGLEPNREYRVEVNTDA